MAQRTHTVHKQRPDLGCFLLLPEFRLEKNIFTDVARRVPFRLSARTDAFQVFWQQRRHDDLLPHGLSRSHRQLHGLAKCQSDLQFDHARHRRGYAQQGYFVWTKGASGYPWDVKTFDKNRIYDRATELVWMDPTTFKRFNKDLPLSPRCISPNGGSATIRTKQQDSAYSFYSDCTVYRSADLSYVTTQVSKPVMVDTGGNLGQVKTRTLTYSYSCNSSYSNCLYKEVYSLGYNVGLYDWKYYVSQNRKWQLVQDSIHNDFSLGQSVPMLACPNMYQ